MIFFQRETWKISANKNEYSSERTVEKFMRKFPKRFLLEFHGVHQFRKQFLRFFDDYFKVIH